MICPKCGYDIPVGAKFCTSCGRKADSASEQPQNTTTPEIIPVTSSNMQTLHNETTDNNSSKSKLERFWGGLSLFSKITAIAMAVVVILVIIALCTKNAAAIVFSMLQLSGLIVAILMNNNVIPLRQQWVKHIILAAAILFTILNIASYSWGKGEEAEKSAATSQPSVTSQPSEASQPIVSDTTSSAASSEDTSVAAPPEVVENNEITIDNGSLLKSGNYEEIKSKFEALGFINIKTEAVYDIVWGITETGSVKSVSIAGTTSFMTGDVFPKDAEVVISYHMPAEDDPSNITMPKSSSDYEGEDYSNVEKEMKNLGFTNVKTEKQTTNDEAKNGKVYAVKISGSDFKNGDSEKPDREVVIKYYEYEKPAPVSYSTNDYETAKKGNTGVFAYKSTGGVYSNYWIIDFDEGYVYSFSEGNGNEICDRVKIVSGDLNDGLKITYHDDVFVWSYVLHFKYFESPSTLILIDNDGFDYSYSTTNLKDALVIRNTKKITDY